MRSRVRNSQSNVMRINGEGLRSMAESQADCVKSIAAFDLEYASEKTKAKKAAKQQASAKEMLLARGSASTSVRVHRGGVRGRASVQVGLPHAASRERGHEPQVPRRGRRRPRAVDRSCEDPHGRSHARAPLVIRERLVALVEGRLPKSDLRRGRPHWARASRGAHPRGRHCRAGHATTGSAERRRRSRPARCRSSTSPPRSARRITRRHYLAKGVEQVGKQRLALSVGVISRGNLRAENKTTDLSVGCRRARGGTRTRTVLPASTSS